MAHKIQIKRGDKADLPTLDVGEFGLCQDTNELFIGNSGNQKIFPPTKSDIGLGNVGNYSIATQSEAESGTANNRYMTPLRTKQAINTHNIHESSHQDIRQQINDLDANKADEEHEHTKSDITDFPSSLPANGGNSDTVDNKHIWVGAEESRGTNANTIYFCY